MIRTFPVIALALALMLGRHGVHQDRAGAAPPSSGRGLHVIATEKLAAAEVPGRPLVTHPVPPIFRTDDAGFPVVSEAGFVQLRHSGPGFFYASTLGDNERFARRRGRFDADNWGDVEGFRMATRVIRRWRAAHPDGPRLGIGDISSRWAGFMDSNRDGASDHRTHQLGMNFNFLLPSKVVPEVEVHLGRQNEEAHDPALTRELAGYLLEEGAIAITTSRATGLADPPESFPLPVHGVVDGDEDTTVHRVGRGQALILLHAAEAHGNHINAWFCVTN